MGKSGENDPGSVPPSSRARDTQIFMCDASAEGGRLLSVLAARGYAIVDVPLGLLPNRIHYEIPEVVICDADAHEAGKLLEEMLTAAGEPVQVALIGEARGAISTNEALRKLADLVIPRPVDLDTAVDKVAALAGAPARGSHRPRIGLPRRSPVLVASARKPYRSDGEPAPKHASSHPPDASEGLEESLWPVDSPPSRGPSAVDSSRLAYDSSAPGRASTSTAPPSSGRLSLSPETRSVLDDGRRKVKNYPTQNSPRPIRLAAKSHDTGEEIRKDFLDALSEPLGDADPDDDIPDRQDETSGGTSDGRTSSGKGGRPRVETSSGRRPSEPTGPIGMPGVVGTRTDSRPAPEAEDDDEPTNPGGRPPTQPPGPLDRDDDNQMPPQLDDLSDLLTAKSSRPPPGLPAVSVPTERPGAPGTNPGTNPELLPATVPPPSREPPSLPTDIIQASIQSPPPDSAPSLPASLAPQPRGEAPQLRGRPTEKASFESTWNRKSALYALAHAIQERLSGAVAQQEGIGLRRIVLTDGDISTVTSTLQSESLAHFLLARGDITEEVLRSLGSLPGFGRHAGAALIARGLLQQEDLWPVLRSHAEWILGRALLSEEETLLEETVPQRILEEPAVFGGAAGTEIYIEAVRRVVSPEQAMALLGSGENILSMGRHESLLGESALDQGEQQLVLDAVGKPLSQLQKKRPDLLSVVLGLAYLDIFSTGGEAPEPASDKREDELVRSAEIDDEAFVARVMTRRALVDDGDYFSILGVSRSATGYEIDRARKDLLDEYSEARLTPRTVHLQEDLRLLRETIDEAHLVLRDDVRRLRYRAALEAEPRGF